MYLQFRNVFMNLFNEELNNFKNLFVIFDQELYHNILSLFKSYFIIQILLILLFKNLLNILIKYIILNFIYFYICYI